MRIEPAQKVEAFTIFDRPALDPVTVILQDFGGSGRIIIECYGLAWSTYFGAIGTETLRQFIATAGKDYLANRIWPPKQRRTKADYGYVERIVEAVQTAIREQQARGYRPPDLEARIAQLERFITPLMDFRQYRLNRGSYCMHFTGCGGFCGRAQDWPGHTGSGEPPEHPFVPGAPVILPPWD
jgi:hypothetical protein